MKPSNWSKMTTEEKRENAVKLLNSGRGKLIIGQALARAAAVMRTEKYPETSNIEDMEELGEVLFGAFYRMYTPEGQKAAQKAWTELKLVKT
jgi:hypothetical protein